MNFVECLNISFLMQVKPLGEIISHPLYLLILITLILRNGLFNVV